MIIDLKTLTKEFKSKEKECEELKEELKQSNLERRGLQELMSRIPRGDTVINNTDNSVQQNNFELKCFDPSMIQGVINPPNHIIAGFKDLSRLLQNQGVRNTYRVNDKSRGTLTWNKPGGRIHS